MASPKQLDKNTSFLIVGAGTIGLSTALHLSDQGYKNIKVIDRAIVPSPYSAGNDLNKIVRADYEDHFYASHALDAIRAWSTPFWSPFYKQTGYAIVASPDAPEKARAHIQNVISSISSHPEYPEGSICPTPDAASIRKFVPQIKGQCSGWHGYFNKHAGYARAGLALKNVHDELSQRGVVFEFGARGEAEEVITSVDSKHPHIRTKSGMMHTADFIIIALGAHTAKLLPSAAAQLTAKAWAVGHIQLTPDEAVELKGMPVINCRDFGFLFEPDLDNGLIKLCANGGGYTNYIKIDDRVGEEEPKRVSVPPSVEESHAGIPVEDEKLLRILLSEVLPQFKDRPLVNQFVCWCADTKDSEYIIDYVPGWNNLILAGGDSGHAFKMFPIFGKWVVEAVVNGKQSIDRWKWKDTDPNDKTEDIGWRVGSIRDIKQVDRTLQTKDHSGMIASLAQFKL